MHVWAVAAVSATCERAVPASCCSVRRSCSVYDLIICAFYELRTGLSFSARTVYIVGYVAVRFTCVPGMPDARGQAGAVPAGAAVGRARGSGAHCDSCRSCVVRVYNVILRLLVSCVAVAIHIGCKHYY